MDKLRTFVVGGAIGALAAVALGTAAIGADTKGTLAIVNGIPGAKVDVCINGDEIKSGLSYGGHVYQNDTGIGAKNLKFYAHDSRRCKGIQLGQASFTLDPAEDLTIVVTKKSPKVVIFDDAGLGEIPPRGAGLAGNPLTWRNASEMPVNFRYRYWTPNPEVPSPAPAADPVFGKGQQYKNTAAQDAVFQLRARLPEAAETIALIRILTSPSLRDEFILVGTNPGNAKFVTLDRVVSAPS